MRSCSNVRIGFPTSFHRPWHICTHQGQQEVLKYPRSVPYICDPKICENVTPGKPELWISCGVVNFWFNSAQQTKYATTGRLLESFRNFRGDAYSMVYLSSGLSCLIALKALVNRKIHCWQSCLLGKSIRQTSTSAGGHVASGCRTKKAGCAKFLLQQTFPKRTKEMQGRCQRTRPVSACL